MIKKKATITKKKVLPVAPGDFKTDLLKRLKDGFYARGYLLAVFDECCKTGFWELLELAAKDVAEAQRGKRKKRKV